MNFAHRDNEEEVVDGLRHQLHGAAAQQHTQRQPQQRAYQAEHARLEQDEREDLAAGHAQRAQAAQHRPPLDDAKGDGVVDEEHAHHQRQQTERCEVEAKGARHLVDSAGACRGLAQQRARRQRGADCIQLRRARSDGRHNQVNAVELAHAPQQFLRAGDVGNQQSLDRAPAQFIRRRKQPHNRQRVRVGAVADREAVARGQPVALRHVGAEQHRVGRGHEFGEVVSRGCLRLVAEPQIAAKGLLGEGVHAKEAHGLCVECNGGDVILDHGRAVAHALLRAQLYVERLVKPAGAARDCVRGAPGHALGAQFKGALRRAIGEINGHNHGDANRHAQNQKDALQRSPQGMAPRLL